MVLECRWSISLSPGSQAGGDENHYFEGLLPVNVVANREEVFSSFLASAPDEVYWFCEADYIINNIWPDLEADCAMLYRKDAHAPMTPAWRLAKPSALPLFIDLRNAMRMEKCKSWHGDTHAFRKVWTLMGSPKEGTIDYKGVKIEMRDYTHYVKHSGKYTRHSFNVGEKEKLCLSL